MSQDNDSKGINFVFLLLSIVLVASFAGGIVFLGQDFFSMTNSNYKYSSKNQSSQKNNLNLPKEKQEIFLMFVGDIMLDRGVELQIKRNNDWKWPFLKIASATREADIMFGNLESQISDKGRNAGSKYSFRADPRTIQGLKYAGFDVVSVSNNHSGDWTKAAFEDSLKRLSENGIMYAGGGFNDQEAYSPAIKKINGTKIGYLAYTQHSSKYMEATENSSGIALLDEKMLQDNIRAGKNMVDILIVSAHWGSEYKTHSNKVQQNYAHIMVDAGADLIIGHHPHVAQEIEQYKGKYIAYSLGNFVFDQDFSKKTMESVLLKAIVERKEITEITPIKIRISPSFQPFIAESN